MTARDLTNTDTNKMSEPKFGIMIIIILAGVKSRLETPSVEIKEVKASKDEIKNAITELQSRRDAMEARMDEAEERISNIEDKLVENNESEKKRRLMQKNNF